MPGPVATARPRRQRLASLNSPHFGLDSSTTVSKPGPTSPAAPPRKRHTCCSAPEPNEDNTACNNCGTIWEDNQIVSEVTFGETAAGAAVVQGATVRDGQRYANTMGGTVRGLGSIESREQTEMHGLHAIRQLCAVLHLSEAVETQAFSLYKLASINGFVKGRGIRNVAAATIYLTCRRRRGNTLLLVDLAEALKVNVWRLGDIYKEFLKAHFFNDPSQDNDFTIQEIEPLMLKYCRKLEFHEDSHKVAEDAVKILKRMKRDWMVQGRQPAGLCGACIILAARMNNFRRTVREVVYVVKVADSTINQRLHEFRRTRASELTINQFRNFGERLKVNIEPPAIYKRREKAERKEERKRKRDSQDVSVATEEELAATEIVEESSANASNKRPQKKQKITGAKAAIELRRDADGFVIPNRPAESALVDADNEAHLDQLADAVEEGEELEVLPKRRGRPRKKLPSIVIPEEELEIEAEIEHELLETITDFQKTFQSFNDNDNHPVLLAAGRRALTLTREYKPDKNVPDDAEIGEDEFADDPEVMNCLNTPEERRRVERIWVTENEDWLRQQQAKMLQAELDKASGKVEKPKKKRNQSRMGDLSVLGGQPAGSAREAAGKMFSKRAPKQANWSKRINYDILNNLFGPEEGGNTTSEGSTPAGQAASPESRATPQPVAAVEEEVVEDVENEEQGYNYADQGHAEYDEEGEFIDPGHGSEEETYDYDE